MRDFLEEHGPLALFAVVAAVGLVCMSLTAIFAPQPDGGADAVRKEAVAAGCAEWAPGADGRPEFRWKAPGGQRP